MSSIEAALAEVGSRPDSIERHFPSAARRAAREGRDGDDVRVALLLALNGPAEEVSRLVERVYRQGDPAERRAVLHALAPLDDPTRAHPIGASALPIVR